jgi:hypothetical protein
MNTNFCDQMVICSFSLSVLIFHLIFLLAYLYSSNNTVYVVKRCIGAAR